MKNVFNVRDYGALGTASLLGQGGADDTEAFQKATDACYWAGGGIVYVPPVPNASYRITRPILFGWDADIGCTFLGDGYWSAIFGNVAGYLFDRTGDGEHALRGSTGPRGFDRLRMQNFSWTEHSGCIRMLGCECAFVKRCMLTGLNGVNIGGQHTGGVYLTADTCFSSYVKNCAINGLSDGINWPSNGSGVTLSNHTFVEGCSIVSSCYGVTAYGAGCRVQNCRIERNLYGINWGSDDHNSPWRVTGGSVRECQFEANAISVYVGGSAFSLFETIVVQGSWNAPNHQPDYGFLYWAGSHDTFRNIVISTDVGFKGLDGKGNGGFCIKGQPDHFIVENSTTPSFELGPGVDLSVPGRYKNVFSTGFPSV
jgi:hypothetical protein